MTTASLAARVVNSVMQLGRPRTIVAISLIVAAILVVSSAVVIYSMLRSPGLSAAQMTPQGSCTGPSRLSAGSRPGSRVAWAGPVAFSSFGPSATQARIQGYVAGYPMKVLVSIHTSAGGRYALTGKACNDFNDAAVLVSRRTARHCSPARDGG
jgi:hypothetical protein